MVLKEFSVNFPGKGSVDVSFYFHFDTNTVTVGEIKIHADFDCALPHRAWLKQDEGVWKLYDDHPKMQGGEVVVVPEFLDDDISNEIVRRILFLREQESN